MSADVSVQSRINNFRVVHAMNMIRTPFIYSRCSESNHVQHNKNIHLEVYNRISPYMYISMGIHVHAPQTTWNAEMSNYAEACTAVSAWKKYHIHVQRSSSITYLCLRAFVHFSTSIPSQCTLFRCLKSTATSLATKDAAAHAVIT